MRFLVLLLSLVGVVWATPASAQVARERFDIQITTDTTFTFNVGSAHWVSRGKTGIAVDPAQGDVLIARFRVTAVRDGIAEALVTGQTGRLTPTDVAVLRIPRPPFFLDPLFWIGAAAGAVVAVAASRL